MATPKTKAVLKTYFEQGDIPTQGQYVDLIDSQFGLGETGTQIIQGTISASAAEFEQMSFKKLHLPSNGVGSMKVGTTFTVGKTLEVFGSLNLNILYSGSEEDGWHDKVVDSGSFSASGDLTIRHIATSGHITSSGTISASGDVIASFITSSGGITSSAGITASSAHFSGPITSSGISSSGNIIVGGTISSSGAIYGAAYYIGTGNDGLAIESSDGKLDFAKDGAGLTNLKFGVPITASYAVSASGLLTVDTLTIGATYNNTSITFADLAFTNNNKAFSITTTLPTIGSGTYCDDTTVTNSSVTTNSVIIASANRGVSVFCHTIVAGSFKYTATGFAADFSSAAVRINFIVL